jgi:hypothetical protein
MLELLTCGERALCVRSDPTSQVCSPSRRTQLRPFGARGATAGPRENERDGAEQAPSGLEGGIGQPVGLRPTQAGSLKAVDRRPTRRPAPEFFDSPQIGTSARRSSSWRRLSEPDTWSASVPVDELDAGVLKRPANRKIIGRRQGSLHLRLLGSSYGRQPKSGLFGEILRTPPDEAARRSDLRTCQRSH